MCSDPFTGTGIFLVRLLQSTLVRDKDLPRKYREELHANEIVLLAYYIAAIHIEEAFHGRLGAASAYEPFGGIVLTDTFNLHTDRGGFPRDWLPDNSERPSASRGCRSRWSSGTRPGRPGRGARQTTTQTWTIPRSRRASPRPTRRVRRRPTEEQPLRHLQDGDPLGLGPDRRPGSGCLGDERLVDRRERGFRCAGVPGGGVQHGLRAEPAGNQRTQGERSRQEGGKVFGQGSRAPVAITILVRNPDAAHDGCRILYRDIGDYLKREKKLEILREAGRWRAFRTGARSRRTGTTTGSDSGTRHTRSSIRLVRRRLRSGRSKEDQAIFRTLFSNGLADWLETHTSITSSREAVCSD